MHTYGTGASTAQAISNTEGEYLGTALSLQNSLHIRNCANLNANTTKTNTEKSGENKRKTNSEKSELYATPENERKKLTEEITTTKKGTFAYEFTCTQ